MVFLGHHCLFSTWDSALHILGHLTNKLVIEQSKKVPVQLSLFSKESKTKLLVMCIIHDVGKHATEIDSGYP